MRWVLINNEELAILTLRAEVEMKDVKPEQVKGGPEKCFL